VLGLVIAIVPRLVYTTFEAMEHGQMDCYATSIAEIPVGAALTALSLIWFYRLRGDRPKVVFSVAFVALGALALLLPLKLTGLCGDPMMACRLITQPVLTVSAILIFITAGIHLFALRKGYAR